MIKISCKIGSGLLLATLILGAGPATKSATRPAFADDAFDLGSADFAVRQAATRRLWWAGDAAEPMLHQAAVADNPEAALRAKALLQKIEDGIAPSTPQSVIDLVRQYHSSNNFDRPRLISSLRGAGIDGVRAILCIAEHESDARARAGIERLLATGPRLAVALLIGQGKRADAEAILTTSSTINFYSARDFVSYWLIQPSSPAKDAALGLVNTRRIWWTQAMLEQASGDHALAMKHALTSGKGELSYRLAAQSADWSELQRELTPKIAPTVPQLRDVELRALVANLAGDSATAIPLVDSINAWPIGVKTFTDPMQRSASLCFNDRPTQAAERLVDAKNYLAAAEMFQLQLDYPREFALLETAKNDPIQSAQLRIRLAMLLDSLGEKSAAVGRLGEAIRANRSLHDPGTAALQYAAARRIAPADQADALFLSAISLPQANEVDVLQKAGFADPVEAQWWWNFLLPGHRPIQALNMLRGLHGGQMPVEVISHLEDAFDDWSFAQPTADRPTALRAQATAWMWAGRADKAMDVLQRWADAFPSSTAYMALGDCAEQRKAWSDAALAYGDAARCDPGNAPAFFLHGWALIQLGQIQQGREQIELAHELAMGDDLMRTQLITLARNRGLTADADRDRDILLTTGNYNESGIIPFLEMMTADAAARKDWASAAKFTEQTLWATAYSRATFRSLSAYIRLPGQLHRLRAMALFAAHQPDRAMTQAKIWYDNDPNNSTALIALVRVADSSGAAPQGDELFDVSVARFAELLKEYPDSPELHNQIAWEESRCRRKLDDALANAQRAADLAPQDAAILDTLAETHYQRHEFQSAIDAENRCIALEPNDPLFKKRLARFQLGLKTGTVNGD